MIKILRDIGDILDRWSISKLKAERIGTPENIKENKAFSKALEKIMLEHRELNWDKICNLFVMVNDFIWQFESGSKSGKESLPNPHYLLAEENKEVLSKLGIINCEIKNYNALRIALKNFINDLLGEGFMDVKKNHLSEKKI